MNHAKIITNFSKKFFLRSGKACYAAATKEFN